MIKEYRKKTTIKAEQFDGSIEMVTKYDIDDWEKNEMPYHRDPRYFLPTKEGLMALGVGDWIATGIDGEHWAIADDIFQRTYEEVSNE